MVSRRPALGTYVPSGVTVRVEPLLRIHGYRYPERVRRDVREHAERAVGLANSLIDPIVVYKQVPVERCDAQGLVLGTGVAFESPVFMLYANGAREVVVFVLTAGAGFGPRVEEFLARDDVLDALFLETAGWLGIEGTTRSFARHLRGVAARRGWRITRRLGPGYSYRIGSGQAEWELRDQSRLFEVFGDAPLPVELLESGVMLPKLSRSGLYGFVPRTPDCAKGRRTAPHSRRRGPVQHRLKNDTRGIHAWN